MGHLIILSGASGVGKNTLIDRVNKNLPHISYFKKVSTRFRRDDDRDAEADFITLQTFNDLMKRKRIGIPYQIRGYQCGIPIDSFAALKDKIQIVALGDFDLIEALRDSFDTTTVYVIAPVGEIHARLDARQDIPEQRQKSKDAVEQHLTEYWTNRKELFDYEVLNVGIDTAAKQLTQIVEAETNITVKCYDFLIPKRGCSQREAQAELDRDANVWYNNKKQPVKVTPFYAFPDYNTMKSTLNNLFGSVFASGQTLFAQTESWVYDEVVMHLDAKRDRERDYTAFCKISLRGRKRNIERVSRILEEKFPEMVEGSYKFNRGQDKVVYSSVS